MAFEGGADVYLPEEERDGERMRTRSTLWEDELCVYKRIGKVCSFLCRFEKLNLQGISVTRYLKKFVSYTLKS